MSSVDIRSDVDVSEPLTSGQVRTLVKAILGDPGCVGWTKHAHKELAKDAMTMVDATNVLRNWRYMDPPEQDLTTGEWKYRIHTDKMGIVVKFRTQNELTVITAWRK